MAVTSSRLLDGVKRRITLVANTAILLDPDILQMADDIIQGRMVSLLKSVNQEFFVTKTEEDVVASQSVYSIPYRAAGRSLRDLKIVDSNNNRWSLALIALEDAHLYMNAASTVGFYFYSDKVHLVPEVPSTLPTDMTLEFWWELPPNKLCEAADACVVTGISGDIVTVDNVPTDWEAGTLVDFIQGKSGNSIYEFDAEVTNITGTQVTFGTDVVPDDLAIGDYLSLTGTSPVINFIPDQLYPLIESETCYRVLQAIGDYEGAKFLMEDISKEEKYAKSLIEPRIEGEPTVIINRQGLVRRGRMQQRNWATIT